MKDYTNQTTGKAISRVFIQLIILVAVVFAVSYFINQRDSDDTEIVESEIVEGIDQTIDSKNDINDGQSS